VEQPTTQQPKAVNSYQHGILSRIHGQKDFNYQELNFDASFPWNEDKLVSPTLTKYDNLHSFTNDESLWLVSSLFGLVLGYRKLSLSIIDNFAIFLIIELSII
jgi:hypothetical protein